jgi:hypothetical protein
MFRLSFTYLQHRGAIATLEGGTGAVEVIASSLSDGLGDLVRSTAALVRGPEQATATVQWVDEPGERRWLLEREGESLRVRLLWFSEAFSRRRDEDGRPEFVKDCRVAEFAGQVKSQFERLLAEHGPDGYAERWGYAFPQPAYDALAASIRERQRRAT